MPIFLLGQKPVFPPAYMADEDGILAVGGDLSPDRLISAYAQGIFPWYAEGDPITWWSPDPRLVLLPEGLHISNSMNKLLKKNPFKITCDQAFQEVIKNCRQPGKNREDTWITTEMRDAYINLHEMGLAHSVETWQQGELVGGFYGVSLGKAFFGESMFFKTANASKFAFIKFAQKIFASGFMMIDCQVPTQHLKSLGAREIPRDEFLLLLAVAIKTRTKMGKWDLF